MDKEILTLEEAAELFAVSIKTFIKLLKEEKVPARKIGREWRFSRSALIQWLSSGDSQSYSASEGETREFFNKVAPEWEKIRKGYDETVKNKLLEAGILKANTSVVDLGCGDGYLSKTMAPRVAEVIAVDISAEMLKLLEQNAKDSGLSNIRTVESDGREMPLGDGSVDLICASMYLHHFEEPEQAIKEMRRVLRTGGQVFIAELSEHANTEMMEQMHDLWPGFKQQQLKQWFSKKGFTDIKLQKYSGKADDREDVLILTAYCQ